MARIVKKSNRAKKVFGTTERPRLCVKKTLRHIIAQVVNDEKGVTLAYAVSGKGEKNNIETAKKVGTAVAKSAVAAGVKQVVFDRRDYYYHGKVKALAEGAREAGLSF
jgi:large subunit ribosomal protein L18